MYADRIYILDEAYCDLVVVCVADNLELKLFPAEDTFLDQYLSYERSLKTSCAYDFQLVYIVYHSAACAAHGVGGTENYRIFQLFGYLYSLIDRICYLAPGHTDAESAHSVLEFDTVLTALDSVYLNAYYLNAVLLEDACLVKLGAEVEARLAAEVGEKSVGALLFDYLSKSFEVERLDVSNISNIGIRHDSCGVRVHKDYLVAQLAQSLAGLCA